MRFRPTLRVFKFNTANCSTEEHYYLCVKSKEASNCSETQGTTAPGIGRRKRSITSMYEHFHKMYLIIIGLITTFTDVQHNTDSLDLMLDPQKSVKRQEDLDSARKQAREE